MAISKILIVDDDEDIRTVSEVAARRIGQWEVVLAASGEEALERAIQEQPDVILLDVMMPGMDGPMTLAALRRDPRLAKTAVVFITAKAQAREVARLMDLGAVDVIAKPFDPMHLHERINAIWQIHCDAPAASVADRQVKG